MTVTIKFSVRELVGDMRDGAYDVPEGTTISGLLGIAQKEAGMVLNEEVKNSFVFLVGSIPAQWETVLNDGDKVRVLYKILGG